MTQMKRTSWLLVVGMALVAGLLAIFARPAAAQDSAWRAEYWNNPSLGGDPIVVRQEKFIDYNWWDGSPAQGIGSDNFSVRWTKRENFSQGHYRFAATMDDGMRVYLNGNLIIDEWYPSATHTVSKDVYLMGGSNLIVVEYFDGGGQAVANFEWTRIGSGGSGGSISEPIGGGNGGDPGGSFPNWKGEYFTNTSLGGSPAVVRDDRYIDFNWGKESPAYPVIPADRWSARWTRNANYPAGQYKFVLSSDDGARLFVNGVQVINNFGNNPSLQPLSADYFHPGGTMNLRIDYFEVAGPARLKLDIVQVPGGGGGGIKPPSDGCPPVSGFQAMVIVNNVNIFAQPTTNSQTLTPTAKCTLLTLTGFRSSDGRWVSAGIPGTNRYDGWVQAFTVRLGIPLENLTVYGSGGPAIDPTGPTFGGSGGTGGGFGGSGGSGG